MSGLLTGIYKIDDARLPPGVKDLPSDERRQWVHIWNSAYTTCMDKDGSDPEKCEAFAFRNANGVVFGEAMANHLIVTANQNLPKAVLKKVAGIDYLVAPVVLIKQGVLNGEMVPLEEIQAHSDSWNGAPFVLDHPRADGVDISANDPTILAGQLLGRVYNTFVEDDALKGEVWVNPLRAGNVTRGKEVLDRLKNGKPLEVSTAYFRDRDDTPGVHNDEAYASIARYLRPDHLAALLDTEGACNWQDGCGVPRVNKGTNSQAQKLGSSKEGITMEELIKQIVDDGRFGLVAQDLDGVPEEFLKKLVAFLVKAKKEDADAKAAADQVKADADKAAADAKAAADKAAADAAADKDDDKEPPETNVQAPCPKLEALAKAVEDRGGVEAVMALIDGVKANIDSDKASIVGELKANEACAFSEEMLNGMTVDQLVALRKTLRPADYSAQGGGERASLEEQEVALPAMFH